MSFMLVGHLFASLIGFGSETTKVGRKRRELTVVE